MLDLIESILEDADWGNLSQSKRAQFLFRVFFGLLGTFLGIAGVWKGMSDGFGTEGSLALRANVILLFFMLAAFCLFNIAMLRRWKWPWIGLVIAFLLLFPVRIIFGS